MEFIMNGFFSFFRRLQWKLALSYAAVTTATVVILAGLLVGIALFAENQVNTRTHDSFYWSKTGFQDNIPFLLNDPAALQTWLARVQAAGFTHADFQSYTVRESLDYANTYITGSPIFVLDPQLNLVASVPPAQASALRRPFNARALTGYNLTGILDAAQAGDKLYYAQTILQPDGSYIAAFPLRKSDSDPVTAIVIYHLKPVVFLTPTNLSIYTTFFVVTAVIMLLVSLPLGTVFGWLASRGLRRRLVRLSTASKAWSKGDFRAAPRDKSGDEIGELTRNLNSMAEQLQGLLQTRDELARIEERNRLARDLHDTVKQQTYATRMQLSAAKNLLASDPQAAVEHIEAALQLNRETQQELKLIIEELRPAALAGKGLAQALTETAARWQEHTGIKNEVSISGERALPLDVEQALFRVFQEALANIARHAEAGAVTTSLRMTPTDVTLIVADNGRGFEPAAVAPNSLGLTGMKQRLSEVGGTLTIETTLSAGTRVLAAVKLA
jgi:NarL family two-component system sensor histidine kinase LiaS